MAHKHKDCIKQWADGKTIQVKELFCWVDTPTPHWFENIEYRVKPDEFTQSLIDAYKRGDKVRYRLNVDYVTPWYDLLLTNPEDIETSKFDQLRYKWSIEPKKTVYNDSTNDINEILDNFDFEKVKRVMDFLNWEWAGSNGVPEIYELRQHARKLMNTAVTECLKSKGTDYTTECGGFRVECNKYEGDPKIYLRLSFNLESWENWN
jgi:hypothetical protein